MATTGRPAWQLYEDQITRLLASLHDGKLTHDVTKRGQLSTRPRQIDVLAEGTLVGRPISIIVECKHYKKKRVGIDIVESFVGKLIDLGASRGIMYAYAGFTRDAYLRVANAYNPEVALEEYSGPNVGLVPLGKPEPYEQRSAEDPDTEQASYSQGDTSGMIDDPFGIPYGSYTKEDYRHFLLTGSFAQHRSLL